MLEDWRSSRDHGYDFLDVFGKRFVRLLRSKAVLQSSARTDYGFTQQQVLRLGDPPPCRGGGDWAGGDVLDSA